MSMEQKLEHLSSQVAELVEMQKAKEPTQRQILEQQLSEAKQQKDISAVISLSNQLINLKDES